MNSSDGKDTTFITILGRAFSIMERLLLSDEPLGVSQLSRDTGIPKANTFRILKTLEELKAIAPAGDGYLLGSKMIELGAGAKRNEQFLTLTIPYIQRLVERYSETVNLGVPFGDHILVLHSESAEQQSLVATLPPITPLYCSATGKLFLSRWSDDALARYFGSLQPQERTVNTITTLDRFLAERQDILQRNLSYDREEYDYGLSCIAAPILLNGELIAGLSLTGPTSRLQYKGFPSLEAALAETAKQISDELPTRGVTLPNLH